MNGFLVMVLLFLGGISARSIQGGEQLGSGKRWLFDDSAMNGGGTGAVSDAGWLSGGQNPGKRSSGTFGKPNSDKRCLNFFSNGCSNGNGSGLMGDEDAAGQIGKRDAILEDPNLYKEFLAFLYYNRKINGYNAERDRIPDETLLYGSSSQ